MAVYVDPSLHKFRNMIMCHMVADTTEELLHMADAIGVDRKHIQYPDTYREHFDLCKAKRKLAVKAGAIEVPTRQLVLIIKAKRDPR